MTESSATRHRGRRPHRAGWIAACLLGLLVAGGFTADAQAQVETYETPPLTRVPSEPAVRDDVTPAEPRTGETLRIIPNLELLEPIIRPGTTLTVTAEVPDLSGLTVGEARSRLKERRLNLQVNEFQGTDAPRYRIAFQRPAAGTRVTQDSWVYVDTIAWLQVPDVLKLHPEEAVRRLRKAELTASFAERREAGVSIPYVEWQSPEPRSWVPPGTRVALRSVEPRAVEPRPVDRVIVPDVIGQTVARAERIAGRSRLNLAPNEFQETAAPRYRVSRQSPAAGAEAEAGSWIRVDTEAWVQVPEVTGMALGAGLGAIWSAGLEARETGRVQGRVEEERIRSQKPAARAWVPPKSLVTFVVEEPAPVPDVQVPDILGRTPAEAEALLAGSKLRFVEAERFESDEEVERVARQDPPAGTWVEVGSPVRADIAMPRRLIPVPDIVGETLRRAAEILRAETFRLEARGRSSDIIVAQDPPAGTLRPRGSTVTGEIAPPPLPTRKPLVTVPDLLGLEMAPAQDALSARDLRLGLTEPPNESRTGDLVASQDPPAGARVAPGTTVFVTFEAAPAIVPNLVGLTRGAAERGVREAGFDFSATGDLATADAFTEVRSQDPEAGARHLRGALVTADIVAFAVVPDVIGRTIRIAEFLVGEAGFRLTAVGDSETPGQSARITIQSPEAGTRVPPGSLVTVEVEPLLVPVPDVTGMTRAEASGVLASLGLAAGPRGDMDTPGATVENQRPFADTLVPRGTVVTIDLRAGPAWFWWAGGVAAVLLLLLALRFARRLLFPPPAARVTLRPLADPGAQMIEAEESPGPELVVRLRPRPDPGEQILTLEDEDDADPKELRYG